MLYVSCPTHIHGFTEEHNPIRRQQSTNAWFFLRAVFKRRHRVTGARPEPIQDPNSWVAQCATLTVGGCCLSLAFERLVGSTWARRWKLDTVSLASVG